MQPPPRGGPDRAPGCLPATGSDAHTAAKPDHPSICPSSSPPGNTTAVYAFALCLYKIGSQCQQLLTQASAKLLLLGNSEHFTDDIKITQEYKAQSNSDCFFPHSDAILFSPLGSREWFLSAFYSMLTFYAFLLGPGYYYLVL